ncbi:MAG: tRNA(Met) cytidine acetyltransferase [Thermoprotei archaeon]|nr:MAG: tRNA(Met) cytidine acetyltransferase [Thermoprotei archaeon]
MLMDSKDKLPKLSLIRSRLREVVNKEYAKFLNYLRRDIRQVVNARQRRLIVLTGNDHIKLAGIAIDVIDKYGRLVSRLRKGGRINVLYVYHDEFPDARLRAELFKKVISRRECLKLTTSVYEVSAKYLGSTFQVLVMDLVNDLKPNDVGRLLGIVEGGGIVVFLAPPLSEWGRRKTIFRLGLLVPNHPEPRYVFIDWFVRKLEEHRGIYIFNVDNGRLVKNGFYRTHSEARLGKIEFPEKPLFEKGLYELALTQDQVNVIRLIEESLTPKVKKGKHVAIVVIADRGRGKSSAIGIGIVGFILYLLKFKNKVRVAVTARELFSVQSLMELAVKALDKLGVKHRLVRKGDMIMEIKGDRFSIEYWQPYIVLKLGVDAVVVDEAAGIPVPLLHKIWRRFPRSVYATTIHGYEGAGRGFSVRFLKRLREDPSTKLVIYEMEEPIRYSLKDPIEEFQFDALLLDAEPDQLDDRDFEEIKKGNFEYLRLNPNYLFSPKGENILRPLFGIFVLAHYRNEPDDLGRIADAPHHSIRALRLRGTGKVVAVAQLAEEGGIPDDIIEELLKGGNIPGNIIPDRLLKHLRNREYGRGVGWRVVRIAVHINAQGMGIGSYFLERIVSEASERGYDWVGAGFGVTTELLNFWLKNGFRVLHVSPDRNPVSGEYTALVIRPLSRQWTQLVEEGSKEFTIKLLESLHAVYRDFEPDALKLMFCKQLRNNEFAERIVLTSTQLERLKTYIEGVMTFESVCDAVTLLTKKFILTGNTCKLGDTEGIIVFSRVLQGRTWDEIYEDFRIGKVKATNILREVVTKMLDSVVREGSSIKEQE